MPKYDFENVKENNILCKQNLYELLASPTVLSTL